MGSKKDAQSELLKKLCSSFGGTGELSKLLGYPRYLINNWKWRGRVPLKLVYVIGNKLKIPPGALNYSEFKQFYGAYMQELTWEECVRGCGLREDVIKYILSFKQPEY